MTTAADALPPQSTPPEVRLAGVSLHAIDLRGCVAAVIAALAAGRGGSVVTANLDHLRRLQIEGDFRRAYERASLRVCDGLPLVWASRLQGTPLPGRVAGSDLTVALAHAAAGARRSIFFLGGDEGTAEACAAVLRQQAPDLRVAGTSCPPRGFESDPAQLAAIAAALQATRPDIVYVALGSPKQELLIERLRPLLPAAWWLGVGISFSFVAGRIKRAPPWVQRLGLEWLHRLAQEPRRLAKRYLVDGLPFAVRLFSGALIARFRSPRP
jgi:N-acetylglucosaminyldiphosphoundecaprenol N-acetyl-beta-D-mannosaminyltransferase